MCFQFIRFTQFLSSICFVACSFSISCCYASLSTRILFFTFLLLIRRFVQKRKEHCHVFSQKQPTGKFWKEKQQRQGKKHSYTQILSGCRHSTQKRTKNWNRCWNECWTKKKGERRDEATLENLKESVCEPNFKARKIIIWCWINRCRWHVKFQTNILCALIFIFYQCLCVYNSDIVMIFC